MQNKGLLFIPDISGFTRFVNETEIEHSRLIIQELLEILINSNQIGLEVSEIEGDAILFYKFGESPDIKELYRQVEKMFCEFHKNLIAYDNRRYCQCTACTSAADLSLKVITHYGEFTGYNVKDFNKLIGKDIIVAHQLLKNDIKDHEYWLITNSLLKDSSPAGLTDWMKWNVSIKQTESGQIPFHYTQLSELRNEIKPDFPPISQISDKVNMITVAEEYDTDIITLFHASGDFNYRSRWQNGVKAVEEIGHFLPRIGMKCRCIYENGESIIYSTGYSYSPDRIEFCETDEKRKTQTNFLLEKITEDKTKLTIDYYIKKSFAGKIIFNLFENKKIEEEFNRSLTNLKVLVQELNSSKK